MIKNFTCPCGEEIYFSGDKLIRLTNVSFSTDYVVSSMIELTLIAQCRDVVLSVEQRAPYQPLVQIPAFLDRPHG